MAAEILREQFPCSPPDRFAQYHRFGLALLVRNVTLAFLLCLDNRSCLLQSDRETAKLLRKTVIDFPRGYSR
jgi:hypothetical protein